MNTDLVKCIGQAIAECRRLEDIADNLRDVLPEGRTIFFRYKSTSSKIVYIALQKQGNYVKHWKLTHEDKRKDSDPTSVNLMDICHFEHCNILSYDDLEVYDFGTRDSPSSIVGMYLTERARKYGLTHRVNGQG